MLTRVVLAVNSAKHFAAIDIVVVGKPGAYRSSPKPRSHAATSIQ